MKTCKTCKCWKRETDDFDKKYHGEWSGDCSSGKFVYDNKEPTTPKDGLEYWDYEGYSAGFKTGEDFGCIHYAPKGAPEGEA